MASDESFDEPTRTYSSSIEELGPIKESHQVVKCYQQKYRWIVEDFLNRDRAFGLPVDAYQKSPSIIPAREKNLIPTGTNTWANHPLYHQVPPTGTNGMSPRTTLYLSIYPSERSRATSFSIYLNLEDGCEPIEVDATIGLELRDGSVERERSFHQVLVRKARLLTVPLQHNRQPHELLTNGKLKVLFTLNSLEGGNDLKNKRKSSQQHINDVDVKKPKNDRFIMAQLVETFADFNDHPSQAENFSDFKVVCGDKVFHCHKVFLALRSEVFSAMFEHDLAESRENQVIITDLESSTVGNMLNFIYTDRVKDECITSELLAAANKYDISLLRQMCERNLLGRLSINNAAEVWAAIHLHGSKFGQEKALRFMAEFWGKIKDTEECQKVAKEYPELPLNILSYLYDDA